MATAAAITSSSSMPNVVTNNSTTANTAILSLGSSTLSANVTNIGPDAISIGPLSASSVVSTSRSRRSTKTSQHHHSSSGSSTFSATDTKSNHTSSPSLSKSASHSSGSSAESHLKSKSGGQRKWKDESTSKSKSFKLKTSSDRSSLCGDGIGEVFSSRPLCDDRRKWKSIDKYKAGNSSLYKMKGLKWRAFSEQMLDNDGKEADRRKNRKEKGLVRLDQSDMSLFGFCPEQDTFYAVVCDICHATVKPQGLRKHVSHRHVVNIHGHHHPHSHRHVLNYDPVTGRPTTNHFGLSSHTHTSLPTQLTSERIAGSAGSAGSAGDKQATPVETMPSRGLYNMKGLKWKSFSEQMIDGAGNDTDSRKNRKEGGMVRLDQSDMCVYGFCPEQDQFYTVLCDICNMAVKPQGLRKHVSHRHIVDLHGHHHTHTHRHLLNYIGVTADRSSDHFGMSSQTSTAATTSQSASDRSSEKISSMSSSKPTQSETVPNHGLLSQQLSSRSATSGAHSSNSSKSKSKSISKVKSKSGRSSHSSTHSSSASSINAVSAPNRVSTTASPSNGGIPTVTTNSQGVSLSQTTSSVSCDANSSSTSLPRATSSTPGSTEQANQKQLRAPGSTSSSTSSTYISATHTTFPLLSAGSSSKTSPSKHSSAESSVVDGGAPVPSSSSSVSSSSSSSSAADPTTPRRTYGRCNKSLTERILSSLYRHMVKEREYDANKHCGVVSGESSRPCTRSLTCKAHSLSLRRMVSGRSKSFDKLLADHRATKDSQSRAIPDLESSNSSSSIDMDRRSVSSNSNLSVEVQASSTASSQSSITAAGGADAAKLSQSATPSSTAAPKATSSVPDSSPCNVPVPSLPTRAVAPLIEEADLPVSESVETVCMGESDNSIQISINPDGTTQSTSNVNRRAAQNVGPARRRSSEEPHRARVTTRVLDRARVNVPPELLDDSKFSTNIFSPESTVLSGPIRLLTDDDNYSGGSAKRMKSNPEPEVDMSNMSEESKLQLMVQRKVHKKNKILFRDPNQPSPSAITLPPAAEIVAQAFAEENPSATLTDAQVIMDPETNLVSVSVCGRLNPDNMQLNWAPFNQEFIDNTLSQALSPYGITVTTAPTPAQAQVQQPEHPHANTALMPNPEEEGFQIHHLPPLTEEEYNQMRPEFINGMPKPSLMGCPAIKSEIKEEVEDSSIPPLQQRPLILPQIKQEGIKQEIKVEIKEEPLEEDGFGTEAEAIPQADLPMPIQEANVDVPQICQPASIPDKLPIVDEQPFEEWNHSSDQHDVTVTSETALSELSSPSPEPMTLDFDDSSDDESCIEIMQPITTSTGKSSSPEASSSANEKENSGDFGRYTMHSLYGSDSCGYRTSGIGSSRNGYYSRLPKPNHVNTFGLVKFRGRANFKKSIICTRRTNSSIQAYQALFQNHGTHFRRDSVNTLGSIHCTVDSNGAISLNGNSSFDMTKTQNLSSPGGARANSATTGNAAKNAKQTRRQNSGNSPSSQTLKRQSSYLISPTSIQTPPSSPFYKRTNAANAGNRPQVQKRSIIMHFRGNGAGPQHLSKTCAILQSQIVHKLAEQLLGYKKANNTPRSSASSAGEQQSSSSPSPSKTATQKQLPQHSHSSNSSNSKLPSSSSSVTTLMYKSHSSSGNSSSSASASNQASSASKSAPVAASSSASGSSAVAQNSKNNTMKVPRVGVKLGPVVSNNANGKDVNAILIRNNSNNNNNNNSSNTVTQRYTTATPVAIVAPILSHASTPSTTVVSMSTIHNNSSVCGMMTNGSSNNTSSGATVVGGSGVNSARGHNGLGSPSSIRIQSSVNGSSGSGNGASGGFT